MRVEDGLLSGIWFRDRVDPEDSRFRLVELRLPMEPSLAMSGYAHEYVGRAVLHRIRRFAASFLRFAQDISSMQAQRIEQSAIRAEDELGHG